MKNLTKRFISTMFCFIILVSNCMNCFAAEINNNERQMPSGEYNIVTVYINGEEMEVPSIRSIDNVSRDINGTFSVTETIFVPDMNDENLLSMNEQTVSEIKLYGSPRSRGTGDFYEAGYIWFHSTLNYNTIPRNGYTYYDLISFKLEREVYSMAPFNSLNNATARAMQNGDTYDSSIEVEQNQIKEYGTISYNTLYSIPSSWEPVVYVGWDIGVKYNVWIDYANKTDYTLTYTHKVG